MSPPIGRNLDKLVLVVGQGPAGEAVAGMAKQAGFDVLVVDPRPVNTRPQRVTIRQDSVTTLRDLGVYEGLRETMIPIGSIEFNGKPVPLTRPDPILPPQWSLEHNPDFASVLKEAPIGVIALRDLQDILHAENGKQGVRYEAAEATLVPAPTTLGEGIPTEWAVEYKRKDGASKVRVTPYLTFIADGAHSPSTTGLVPRETLTHTQYFVGAFVKQTHPDLVAVDHERVGAARLTQTPGPELGEQRTTIMFSKPDDSTWTVMEMTPSEYAGLPATKAVDRAWCLAHAQAGLRGSEPHIVAGGDRIFEARVEHAVQPTLGENVALMGDARLVTGILGGIGTQAALRNAPIVRDHLFAPLQRALDDGISPEEARSIALAQWSKAVAEQDRDAIAYARPRYTHADAKDSYRK